jgi:hypothetical protein
VPFARPSVGRAGGTSRSPCVSRTRGDSR